MFFNKNNFIFIFFILFIFILILKKTLFSYSNKINSTEILNEIIESEVLLIYVYANTHSDAYGNLKYFIDNAVRENDGVDYYFILQLVDNKTIDENLMPLLPKKNGKYIQHENICFDFGTIGWFFNQFTYGNKWINQNNISNNKINLNKYKYFIFMNSSIRGPFFPPYFIKFIEDYKNEFEKIFYWYYIFTKRINSYIKLIGPTISCIPVPHVQSYIFVTDLIGLNILLKPGSEGTSSEQGIFACQPTKNHVSLYCEVASSNRIRLYNYSIDSLLTKYQFIDFNLEINDECNHFINPYLDDSLDGVSLEPYEVVFIKYNDLPHLHIPKDKAKLYQSII